MTTTAVNFGSEFQAWSDAVVAAKQAVNSIFDSEGRRSTATLPLPVQLWKLAGDAGRLAALHSELNARVRGVLSSGQAVSAVNVRSSLETTLGLTTAIETLYSTAKGRGLTNRTLTAASLNRIKWYGEEIFDSAQTLALMLDPATEESFRAARDEFESGECVGMEIFS